MLCSEGQLPCENFLATEDSSEQTLSIAAAQGQEALSFPQSRACLWTLSFLGQDLSQTVSLV